MRSGRSCAVLLVWALVLGSCEDGGEEKYSPLEPNVEDDVYSEIARAVRAHNGGEANDLEALLQSAMDETGSTMMVELLEQIGARLDDEFISPVWATYLVALAKPEGRDRVYLLYGHLSDQEIADEQAGYAPELERYVGDLGYVLHEDYAATFEEWEEIVRRNDAAAFIWRSHGNLERSPYDEDGRHFMARILTTEEEAGSRSKIWAADWEAILPEGLVHVAMSTCMSDGLYLDEDWDLVEGDPGFPLEEARITTFETTIADRALYYRGYRGPSFSPFLDGAGEFAMRRMLPDRTGAEDQAPWGFAWTHLFASFDEWRRSRSDDVWGHESYCRLDWFRCLFEGVGQWAVDMKRDETTGSWTLTIPEDGDREYRCPVGESIIVTVDSELNVVHNLADVLNDLDLNDVLCTSV